MRLVFASNNAHKLAEVREIMPAGIEVLSLRDIGFAQEIDENGATLEENSRIKAEAVCRYLSQSSQTVSSGVPEGIEGVFADDTGLEIDALGGRPGVHTARWWQEDGHAADLTEREVFAANRAKALRELAGRNDRGCQFRTVITLALTSPENKNFGDSGFIQVEGIVRGEIANEEYGNGGFGYDPLFIPEGYDKTFGELPAEIKNNISHRARALAELVKVLS